MRIFSRYALQISTLAITLSVGCTDISDNIGNDYMRDDQDTQVRYELFNNTTPDGDEIFAFSQYVNEDFDVSNLSYGTTGRQYKEKFGSRTGGFYSQFTPMYTLDDDDSFGTNPIVHSVLVYLPAAEFSGDTTIINKYKVYRVLNDDFLDDYSTMTKDDAASLFASDKLADTDKFEEVFSFQFPDQANYIYTNSEALFIDYYEESEDDGTAITQAGKDLIDQLLLKSVNGIDIDYTYYDFDNHGDFVDLFKGLYIEWVGAEKDGIDITDSILSSTSDEGVTYSHLLSSCGFGFTCYQDQDDYDTAQDEDGDTSSISLSAMVYSFSDSYSEYGGTSINYVVRTDPASTDEPDNVNNIYVEALGGRVSEMRIKKSFFEWMDSKIEEANEEEENNLFVNIFFNKATIKGYIPAMTSYDMVTDIAGIKNLTTQMNTMPSRIGMYVTYSHTYDDDGYSELETIYDYDTVTEAYYGSVSIYDGYINRSLGFYEMNLQHQLQIMWAEWHDLENKDSITDDELNALEWNRIYIAPSTSNLASVKYATIQGLEGAGVADNGAPLQLEVIYTLRK
ncbi:MAG: hypothetical protein SNG35_06310 [Rikenellaceae bacterium]